MDHDWVIITIFLYFLVHESLNEFIRETNLRTYHRVESLLTGSVPDIELQINQKPYDTTLLEMSSKQPADFANFLQVTELCIKGDTKSEQEKIYIPIIWSSNCRLATANSLIGVMLV